MGQRTGSRRPGEQSHHRIGDATVGAVAANLNPDEEAPSEQDPPMHRVSKFRLFVLALIAPLPSFLMRTCYRLFFGYRIGKRVRLGVSIIDAAECHIEDDVQ